MTGESPRDQKTLTDWVKDFRLKKTQMKRRHRQGGANLRVCAILATALKSAEKELRAKQQERFNRWCEIQSKIMEKKDGIWAECEAAYNKEKSIKEEEERRQKEISDLWKQEITSLDEFMRNMSSQRCGVAAS